jgi:hypothetical protein
MSIQPYRSNKQFFDALISVIDRWCERRCLRTLAAILPSFVSFNGMTDSWGELHSALKSVLAFHRDTLTSSEQIIVADLAQAAADALSRGS